VAQLQYIAQTELRHEDEIYSPGDDVSHFAPLMPAIFAAVSVGQVQLVHDGEPLPIRYEVRTNPLVFGLLQEDIVEAQAAPESAAKKPREAAEAPLTDADGQPEGSDPSEGDGEPAEGGDPDGEADAPSEGFDPSEHTVPEVIAYVEENPDELEAVYVAEGADKARSTLLSKLDELAAADE
jgi:hypothetical protein